MCNIEDYESGSGYNGWEDDNSTFDSGECPYEGGETSCGYDDGDDCGHSGYSCGDNNGGNSCGGNSCGGYGCGGYGCDDCADSINSISVTSTMYRDTTFIGWTGTACAVINSCHTGNCGIVWYSSNPRVVRVDSKGNLTAVGEGTAYIYACACGNPSVYDSFVIHVAPNTTGCDDEGDTSGESGNSSNQGSNPSVIAPTAITVELADSNIYVGDETQLTIHVTPSNASTSVTYKSCNSQVASINASGKVTALSAGRTVITVTSAVNTTVKKTFVMTVTERSSGTGTSVIYEKNHILGYNGHGRCVNIYTSNAANGNAITLYNWTNHADQRWTLERIGTDSSGANTYVIKSEHDGLYLGYTGELYHSLKSCNVTDDSTNAIVTLDTVNESTQSYRIKMEIDGMPHYLTAWAGTSQSTSKLVWYASPKTYDQIWKFVSGTEHPQTHTSGVYNFAWPASNDALVNDGFDGIWRVYNNNVSGATTDHKGIDLSAGNGNCYSMFDGTVTTVDNTLGTARGRYVKIEDSNGTFAIYQHLASINTTNCVKNQPISKGDLIGTIGGSGKNNANAYGVHLHFEVKDKDRGYVDALEYFD